MAKKPKPARKITAPSIPAWTCPKCGAAHPITVPTCCGPTPPATPNAPVVPKRRNPFGTPLQPGITPIQPFQPGIIPVQPYPRPFDPFDFPRGVPQWWTFPPDITCEVRT